MEKLIVYVANDGTKFIDEKICLEYEEEKAKHPDDPGIRFYNTMGEEIDINDIARTSYCVVTNSPITNARYNSIRMLRINQHIPMPVDVGHYVISGNGVFKLEPALFEEIMAKLQHKE